MSQSHALISADLRFLDRQRPLPLLATLAVRLAVTTSKWADRAHTRKLKRTRGSGACKSRFGLFPSFTNLLLRRLSLFRHGPPLFMFVFFRAK